LWQASARFSEVFQDLVLAADFTEDLPECISAVSIDRWVDPWAVCIDPVVLAEADPVEASAVQEAVVPEVAHLEVLVVPVAAEVQEDNTGNII